MKFGVYSVYDDKAKAFLTPFFLPTDAMAIREFSNMANEPTHMFCKNSEDFVLYRLDEWNSTEGAEGAIAGEFRGESPAVLGRAVQFKRIMS